MGASASRDGKEASGVLAGRDGVPVPAPPGKPPAKPRVHQVSASMRREHEVQCLIRDLAALAASRRPQVP